MERQEVKKFFKMSALFLAPFVLALFVELFVLPVDFFAYRSWEALKVKSEPAGLFLPGPFYPGEELKKTEVGDLGAHTSYEVPKEVVWRVNDWGDRTDADSGNYDVLIAGDSTVVGTSLSQEDILSSQLARETGLEVYSMGAKEIQNVLNNPHFVAHKPKVAVLVSIERFVGGVSLSLEEKTTSKIYFKVMNFMDRWHLKSLQPVFVTLDRLLKQNMYNSVRASVDRWLSPEKKLLAYGEPPMLFLEGDEANREVPDADVRGIAQKIADVNKVLKERGIKFIFFIVPNKETVYWDLLPSHKKPDFIPRLTKELKRLGVATADTETAFLRARAEGGKILYHRDDTHWNADGVRVGAEILASLIKK